MGRVGNMASLDTNGLLLVLRPGGSPLHLDTPQGMEALFSFLSLVVAKRFVITHPQVPTLLLAGFSARAEFITSQDEERLDRTFMPLADCAESEHWAEIIEFFWKQPGAEKLAISALSYYEEWFEGKKRVSNPDRVFGEDELVFLMRRIHQRRTLRIVEQAKATKDFTPEESDLIDRLYQTEWGRLEEEPGDVTLVKQINQKMGFDWIVLPEND